MYGRENAGQLFELSLNYISNAIAKSMAEDSISVDEAVDMYLKYLSIVSPSMHDEMAAMIESMPDPVVAEFISTIMNDDEMLYLDIDPVSETMTIDKLAELYRLFPWIEQEKVIVPTINSNNEVVYTYSRRPVVCGHVYYYRLKQYGKEKFSVTSLSATNIKNENSRNKSSKVYKARYSRTPIRFGDMELGNFTHMGADLVVQLLMLYSTSPEGRMLAESMMTGDPFNIDVKLNDTASNRNVEILNTYLKTIGLRIVFEKVKKQKKYPVQINPINFIPGPKAFPKDPIIIYGKDTDVKLHPNHIARLNKFEKYPIKRMPITFKRPMKNVIERLRENARKSVEDAEAERAALKEREDQQTDE